MPMHAISLPPPCSCSTCSGDVAVQPAHPVDRVELRVRLAQRARVASGVELALRNVDDEERAVVAAFAHLREVDLLRAAHGRVELAPEPLSGLRVGRQRLGRELRLDVLVRVERQHARMDRIGLRHLLGGQGALLGGEPGARQQREQRQEAAHGRSSTTAAPP
jgi:hypothetical protein